MARNDFVGSSVVDVRLPPRRSRIDAIAHEDDKFLKFGAPIEQGSRRLGMIKSPPTQAYTPPPSMIEQQSRNRHQRARNWASGGPGMQAIFLGSNKRSCGTGVFLPRREGTGFQCSNKPAFSPVLLPARVVQALKLNVHELGLHINKPQPEQLTDYLKKNDEKLEEKKKEVQDDHICLSPEIFLPKEWTY